jgi:hypothetical protein
MTLQHDRVTCSTCDTWGHCSQKCIETGKNKHKCTCNDGYLLATDHFTCKSTGIFEYSIKCIIKIIVKYIKDILILQIILCQKLYLVTKTKYVKSI